MPAPEHRLISIFAHLHIAVYRERSGITDEEASRLGRLIRLLLCHRSKHIANSGGWLEFLKLIAAMDQAGLDRAWARVMHALAMQKPGRIQILGVAITPDAPQPEPEVDDPERRKATRRPPCWLSSFGDKVPDYVEREAIDPLSIRPLIISVWKGQSIRVIHPRRI